MTPVHKAGMSRDERLESLIEATKAFADQLATEHHDPNAAIQVYSAMVTLQQARRPAIAQEMDRKRLEAARAS